ncbi:MAG: DNA polymerase III subunit delta [Ruminococcus sp.]|nr:DNA polymerase III subunit delta [Ruminococcus sp.]MBQ1904401.1 DNA polymerase III subunit delta [Ruminococcus sp.]MBQ3935608.1 DNA polymerase III subunit delta [Ruminococcus sp.]
MSSVSPTTLGKDIRDGKISTLYYFYGHDVTTLENYTRRLVNKLCPSQAQAMNLHKFDGTKLDIPALSDACQALPMFAERVVITINDLNMDAVNKGDGDDLRSILKQLEDGTTVIIYATAADLYKNKKSLTDKNKRFCDFCDKNGCVCDFALKTPVEMGRSIASEFSKLGCTISRNNAEYLAEICLCNTGFVKQEIKKLSDFIGQGTVTKEHIDLLCIKHVESDGYSLALNVLRSRAKQVFGRLGELVQQNFEPFEILSIISFSMADIYRAKLARSTGRTLQDIISDFDYPRNREFAVKKMYNECGNISVTRIREALSILSDTDLALKTRSLGKGSDMLTLEQGLACCMALDC